MYNIKCIIYSVYANVENSVSLLKNLALQLFTFLKGKTYPSVADQFELGFLVLVG